MAPSGLYARLCHAFLILNSPFNYFTLLTYTLCLKKNCTPKAGRHKVIKISSPIMIFHTRHRHLVADRLSSKNLVPVKYQLQGFNGNQAPNNRMLFIAERIRRRRRLIYCL